MHLIGSSLKKEEIAGQRCCELDLTLGDALLSPIKNDNIFSNFPNFAISFKSSQCIGDV